MGEKKRKRDEAGAGAGVEVKAKRVKNKVKHESKGNKASKQAAAAGKELGRGADDRPAKARELSQQPAAETAIDGGNEEPKDPFMIDTTPMDQAEVEEKIKPKQDKKKDKKRLKSEERQKKNKKGKKAKAESPSDSKPDLESETESASKTKGASKAKDTIDASTTPANTEGQTAAEAGKHARFIVFVGNLPYTATVESVTAHFSKITPVSVRVATDKNKTTECRGFGFVEFEQFDRMQTCLKLYHHSMFDDGKSPARKINVELTAGGGGKSSARKSKIKEKNEKLAAERARIAKENKGNKEKQQQKQKKQGQQQQKQQQNGETENGQYAGVHPSRLNRMM